MVPRILFFRFSIRYLRDQLIVLDSEVFLENARDNICIDRLGVDDTSTVELLENPKVEIGVSRDVVAGTDSILVQFWISIIVKINVEGENILSKCCCKY